MMSSPPDTTTSRRKKACRRCRQRKQKCDFEQPCHNCQAASVACTPVVAEAYDNYPVGYVPALEHHVAMLERTLNERLPGGVEGFEPQPGLGLSIDHSAAIQPRYLGSQVMAGASPETDRIWTWPSPPSRLVGDGGALQSSIGNTRQNRTSPLGFAAQTQILAAKSPTLVATGPMHTVAARADAVDEIPLSTAASFFQTYFLFIHPQYPFLSISDCGDWYIEWKMAAPTKLISGWRAFFVKMIFAIGSLIQSKSDKAPRYQHQDLKAQAQSEDEIIQSTKSSPLVRLQAMLLSAMYALHSESTARITHISGAIMRFASLHGFHHLVDLGDEESQMKVRAWSCAYILDRGVSATLDVPVSLPDVYISSTLYVERAEVSCRMPWFNDVSPSEGQQIFPTLGSFAHICKIRLIQSYIMHTMQAVPLEGGVTSEWQESMRLQIDNWDDEIYSHSIPNTEGYQSPLWLGLISQLSRLLLCRPSRMNINTHVSDVALKASCDACTTFRALQKKRQIAQPWLVVCPDPEASKLSQTATLIDTGTTQVITQFQAGVTILYITWARGIPMSKEADIAIRDCTSVLAILADRWQNAERYRDCFEVLVRAIPRSARPGYLDRDARQELAKMTRNVDEAGIHRHVATMLWEMASSHGGDDEMES